MSGLIQEGTYGCVVSPPLKCAKSKPKSNERKVGKIIRIKNSVPELTMGTVIKSIEGWHRYFIVPENDDCDARNFKSHRDEYEKMCKVYRSSLDYQLTQLISPYAGVTIRNMNLMSNFDFVGSLRHVLEGVALLNKQGICHFDLHDGNVLVDTRGTFRIIDFGSAFFGDQIDEKGVRKHLYAFSPEFPPQPPEMAMQNGIYGGMSMVDGLEQTMKQKRAFRLAARLIGLAEASQRAELVEFWKGDTAWKGETWVPFFHAYWRMWDSWAVGILFLDILQKCFLLPGFLTTTWVRDSGVIKTVLKGLLASSPVRRFSAKAALDSLESSVTTL
jgi:serine/threonine protein kinase